MKAVKNPCQVGLRLERADLVLSILRLVKCGKEGSRRQHQKLGPRGLVMCQSHADGRLG